MSIRHMRMQPAIGRDRDQAILLDAARIPANAPSKWIYLVGLGGIGKTHLLRNLEYFVFQEYQENPDTSPLCAFVDFQSPDVGLEEGIMQAIVDGLNVELGNKSVAFEDYDQSLVDLMCAQRDQRPQPEIDRLEQTSIEVFRECYARLSSKRRIVLLFDTVEELDRKEVHGSTRTLEMRHFFEDAILTLPGTTFVLAGRDVNRLGEVEEYIWHKDADNKGFELDETPERLEIGPLETQADAEALLVEVSGGQIDDELRRILPRFKDLLDWNPIFLVLAAERYRQFGPLSDADFSDKEKLEEALVQGFYELSDSNDVLLYMALGPYRFDKEMVEAVTGESARSEGKYKGLEKLRFVKRQPDKSISLHDEMRRLLNKYVWPIVDPKRASEQPVLRAILERYWERQQDIQRMMANLVGELQEMSLAQDHVPSRTATTTTLIDEPRKAARLWVDQRQLELQERILVREMWGVAGRLAKLDAKANIGYFAKVFDHGWQLSHTQARAPREERKRLLEEVNKTAQEAELWDDPKRDNESTEAAFTFRFRQIGHELYDQGRYQEAEEAYLELLDTFGDDPTRRVRILIRQANTNVRRADTGLDEAELIFREAWDLCQRYNIGGYRNRIANGLGWVNRLGWDLDAAEEWYDKALEFFHEGAGDPRRRHLNMSQSLINKGYALRERDIHSAIALCEAGYRLREQEQLILQSAHSLSTLSVLYRIKGDYEYSLDLARRAMNVYEPLEERGPQARACLRAGMTLLYMAMDRGSPERLGEARKDLESAYDTLKGLREHYIWSSQYIHCCYLLGMLVAKQDGDIEQGKAFQYEGLKEADKTGNRRYQLNGYRNLIELAYEFDPDLTYDRLEKMPEYYQLEDILKKNPKLKTSGAVFIGDIHRFAGAVAQRDAIHYQRQDLLDKAIKHYIEAFKAFADQKGFSAVIIPGRLEFLREQWDEFLRRAIHNDNRYINVLLNWCVQFEEAWDGNGSLHEATPQILDLVRVFRIRASLRQQATLPMSLAEHVIYACGAIDTALENEDFEQVARLQTHIEETVLQLSGVVFVPYRLQLRQAELLLETGELEAAHELFSILYDTFLDPVLTEQGGGIPLPFAEVPHPEYPDGLDDEYHEIYREGLTEAEWSRNLLGLGQTLLQMPERSENALIDGLTLMSNGTSLVYNMSYWRGRAKRRYALALRNMNQTVRRKTKLDPLRDVSEEDIGTNLREDSAYSLGLLMCPMDAEDVQTDADNAQNPASYFLQQALFECNEDGDKLFVALCMDDLAREIVRQGHYHSAQLYAEQALDMLRELGHWRGVCRVYTSLGIIYRFWGNYVAARGEDRMKTEHFQFSLDNLQEALTLADQIGFLGWKPVVYKELANTYWYRQELGRADECIERGLESAVNERILAELLHVHGHILWEAVRNEPQNGEVKNHFAGAKEVFRKSLELARKYHLFRLTANNLAGLIELDYLEEDRLDSLSSDLYKTILKSSEFEQLEELWNRFSFNLYYGSVRRVLGAVAQGANKLDEALHHYQQGLYYIAKESGFSRYDISEALDFLIRQLSRLGDANLRHRWATVLLSEWKDKKNKPEIQERYPDMITTCLVQQLLAKLDQERRAES